MFTTETKVWTSQWGKYLICRIATISPKTPTLEKADISVTYSKKTRMIWNSRWLHNSLQKEIKAAPLKIRGILHNLTTPLIKMMQLGIHLQRPEAIVQWIIITTKGGLKAKMRNIRLKVCNKRQSSFNLMIQILGLIVQPLKEFRKWWTSSWIKIQYCTQYYLLRIATHYL